MKAVSFLSLLPGDVSCNNNTPTAEFSLAARGLTTRGLTTRGSYNQWSSNKGSFQLAVLQPGALQ